MLDRRSLLLGMGVTLAGCRAASAPAVPPLAAAPRAARLIALARTQVGKTVRYDSAYTALPFPNGDVPREKGVCTDVVIRAYRDAFSTFRRWSTPICARHSAIIPGNGG